MEGFGDEACNVVYFCAGAADDVSELYHKRSPPDAPSRPEENSSTLDRVYHNARILLDENQGGFDEGEADGLRDKASSRVVVLTMGSLREFPPAAMSGAPRALRQSLVHRGAHRARWHSHRPTHSGSGQR